MASDLKITHIPKRNVKSGSANHEAYAQLKWI